MVKSWVYHFTTSLYPFTTELQYMRRGCCIIQSSNKTKHRSYNGFHVAKDMMKLDALSKELAELLIDKIIVSQDKQIEIMWKFTPELRVVS